MTQKHRPKSSITPATRSALIIGGFFVGMIVLAGIWIFNEARRIKRQREASAATRKSITGEMVWIKGGKFTMGSNDGAADEKPLHDVKVKGLWMDKYEVTNEQFTAFVEATGYVTVAERPLTAKIVPGLLPELEGRSVSLCFRPPPVGTPLRHPHEVWKPVVGANWRNPEGVGSSILQIMDHPVVHIAWEDANAYARWAGKRLPTEAEWEYAARGGMERGKFPWGNELRPGGKWIANGWQGNYPYEDTGEDGHKGVAMVGSYPANGYGLHDMAGNVFEWCADWYQADYYARSPHDSPPGPDTSLDPNEPGVWKRVQRGGSWLDAEGHSTAFRVAERHKGTPDTGLSHLGFRCVKDGSGPQ